MVANIQRIDAAAVLAACSEVWQWQWLQATVPRCLSCPKPEALEALQQFGH
eukprot:COSAG06_NODE_26235_length_619_cov_0.603846_1_plen_51_part_00